MILILAGFILIIIFSVLIPAWWWIMIMPFFIYFIWNNRTLTSFAGGATMAALAWLIPKVYMALSHSQLILRRVSEMTDIHPAWLILVASVMIAAVCGGISGLAGSLLRKAILDNR